MTDKFSKPRAGLFFIGCRRFRNMGEGTARGTYYERKEKDVQKRIHALEGFLDLTYPGIIYEKGQVEGAIQCFVRDEVDFIITEFLSWSEDFTWVRFLRDVPRIPILFIRPTKDRVNFEDTFEEDGFVEYLASGGLVGSLEASGSIRRIDGNSVTILTANTESLYEHIRLYANAAKVRSILRNACFGLLANYNELMWSTYVDPYNFFAAIGPEIKFISYSSLVDEIHEVDDESARVYMEELVHKYPVMEDVDNNKFLESVRASLAMANLAVKGGIDALVLNDVDPVLFHLIGLRPGFYHSSFHENLSVVVPEGDVGGGLITFVLKLLSRKTVNFIEPFYIENESGCFAGGHAGPNDYTHPQGISNIRIARDVRFAKTNYKYAGAPFAWYRIPPGRMTMAHISENNSRFKLVCTLVDSLPGEHFITSYSHSMFKPLVPVIELFDKILNIGTTQHFAIVDGDYRKELEYFAVMMDMDFYNIS